MFARKLFAAVVTTAVIAVSANAITPPVAPPVTPMPANPEPIRLGVVGQGSTSGFRINQVMVNTPAADVGLEAGDMLVTINNTVITGIDSLRQTLAFANQNGGHVTMLVKDGRGNGYVQIDADLLEEVQQGYAAPGAPKPVKAKNITRKAVQR